MTDVSYMYMHTEICHWKLWLLGNGLQNHAYSLTHSLTTAYHHISKTIEASRVHLFDVVTQYRAIFPDDDSVRVNYGSKSKGEGPVDGALFYSWVNDKV